jgi:mono/diheme cytochrome c family protein
MRRVLRVASFLLLGLVLLAIGGVGYVYIAFPRMAAPTIGEVAADEALLARGTYLAEHVALCMDCHSERDFSRFSGPVDAKTHGKGGERFGRELGLPGELFAPNITPHALSSWSDGEIIRALTSGVTPDGRALFPIMNWPAYAKLCRRDVEALVAYVRKLSPVAYEPPASQLDFPVNLIARTLPVHAELANDCPDAKDMVKLGAYLVGVAGCADCHSPRDGNEFNPELAFSGGIEMPLPSGGKVRSKNITPDLETGIGSWSRESFIKRFATYRDPANLHEVEQGGFNTLMPWSMYAGMTDEDLGAIYDFLRTQKPVKSAGPRVAANEG